MEGKLVEFLRQRDYQFQKELGQGACGKTVLLYDDIIDKNFVCKKYSPFSEDYKQELFNKFIVEIKLLHGIYHQNVVRVFNYYLYPDQFTGYILMEFIDGSDIEEFLYSNPEKSNEIFLQTISGFRYLEKNQILHRDIRPQNIMVREDGTVKIIDLGFGKRIRSSEDFGKSISLNWWCEPPQEFELGKYDFKTEIYFVGKLFEHIIQEKGIEHFQYLPLLKQMCNPISETRVESFFDIEKQIKSNQFLGIEFSNEEIECYRQFADNLTDHVTKINKEVKYIDDSDRIIKRLEDAYRSVMLEEFVPASKTIIRCILEGEYYYKQSGFPVSSVKEFIRLLKAVSNDKRQIIISNLYTRLDAINRYSIEDVDEDIPF